MCPPSRALPGREKSRTLINCELLPKEKGNYEIHIGDEDAVSVELGVPHKIVLHITGSLIRMDQNSPYSVENPIRKIDSSTNT